MSRESLPVSQRIPIELPRGEKGVVGPKGALLLFLAIFLSLLFPRFYALDQYVTYDEHLWLPLSANFYRAVRTGQFAETYQVGHPGVTTMWAASAGFLWRYPGYAEDVDAWTTHQDIEEVLQTQGHSALELLSAGRVFVVLANALLLALACLFAYRILGLWPTLVGFLFIAFDPFYIGQTRLLHVDGLASSFILLSLLAFIDYRQHGQPASLVISGVAFGLGCLTKSPAVFLLPVLAAIVPVDEMLNPRRAGSGSGRHRLLRAVAILFIWSVIGGLVVVLAWPAMWVEPLQTVAKVSARAIGYALQGHSLPLFFNGDRLNPGEMGIFSSFYPISLLWRASPLTLFGVAFSLLLLVRSRRLAVRKELLRPLLLLLLFSLFFAFMVNLGSKKFVRYLLPIFPPLQLVAAIGWVTVASWLGKRLSRWGSFLASVFLGVVVSLQLLLYLQVAPYPLAYYNPLLGGGQRAPEVNTIGWGEGLDQAARYLNQKLDAEQLTVLSWYPPAFSYYFEGTTMDMPAEGNLDEAQLAAADYAVIYLQQWQRNLPEPFLAMLVDQVPEQVIQINGIEYVRIYRLGD